MAQSTEILRDLMKNANFYSLLQKNFLEAGDAPCLTLDDGDSFSYRWIDDMSARMARALVDAGLKPGDRVAVQVEKSVANVALYLGAMRAGAVYVPLNTAYTPEEVSYFLEDAEPSIFVCAPEKENMLSHVAKNAGVSTVFTLGAENDGSLDEEVKKTEPDPSIQPRHEDDLAAILYTSGTTGRSKGAMLTHNNLASNALALNALWGFTSKDVLLHALPIFHIHGLFVALHTAMLSGCEILFQHAFNAESIRQILPRATVMMGVPTFYSRLIGCGDFGKEETAHMRLFISGSAPLTEETFNAFETRTGHRILERYGMSEAGMIASNPLNGERLPGTVGFALPDVSIRIGNAENLEAPGEVEIKGPNLFKGYWRKPDKTKEAFTHDGYFKTGDIGALDHEGRLSLIGRSKDLIIAGGYNIYPKEIEQVLDALPGVTESAVIGVPHPDMGEGVVAVLVADNDPLKDATLHNAMETLARFKRPRHYSWVDALPRNAMGKVQKQSLRQTYQNVFASN